MDVKPGYKQTEVGVIPEEWATATLEEACMPGGLVRGPFGGALKKEVFIKDGKKVYEQRNAIYRDTSLGGYFISEMKYRELKRFAIKPGDFIVSCSGTIGRIFAIPDDAQPGVINQALLKIETDGRVVNKDYFFYYFDWEKFQRQIVDNTQGGAMQNLVGMNEFRKVEFARPPLPEQRAIAGALSDVDALIGAMDQLIAKKRDLKQAAMQQLLTGHKRLPGFRGEWEVKRLGEVAEVVMGQSPAGSSYNRSGFGVPLVNGPTEFTDKHPIKIQWTSQPTKFCKKGDLLLCVRGSSTGRINISDDEYCIGRGVAAIRARSDADTSFITFQVAGAVQSILAATTGSTFPNIDGKSIRAIEGMFPLLAEQTAIADVLSDMDAELAALEQRRDKTRALKQGMMQELLTGRTRLV